MRPSKALQELLFMHALFGAIGNQKPIRALSSWTCPAHIQDEKMNAAQRKREVKIAKRIHWRNQMILAGAMLP